MLVLLVFGFSGLVWFETSLEKKIDGLDHKIDNVESSLSKRIDGVESSLNKRIDSVESSLSKRIDNVESSLNKRIDDLKSNDFAHLNNTIEALTFTLKKNGFLKTEDKQYIDSRLAH
jgi:tetrahydromethanopterin S-methyltransferase subunit G